MVARDEEQKPERRREHLNLIDVLEHFERLFREHEERDDARYGELRASVDNWVGESERRFEGMESAFPDGDTNGHRTYHEGMLRAARRQEEFWDVAQKKVIEHGIAGLFAVLKIVLALALAGGAVKLGLTLPAWLGGGK